jgi:hypothetical protein
MGPRDVLRPGVLLHVAAQDALQRRHAAAGATCAAPWPRRASPRPSSPTTWPSCRRSSPGCRRPADDRVGPRTTALIPTTHGGEQKADFVRRAAATRRWRLAWDLGCRAPAPTPASSRRTPTTSWQWTATPWRSSASTGASGTATGPGRSLRSSSTSPDPRRTKVGSAPSARAWPSAAAPISRSAWRSSTTSYHGQHPAGGVLDWLASLTPRVVEWVGRDASCPTAWLATARTSTPTTTPWRSRRSCVRFVIEAEEPRRAARATSTSPGRGESLTRDAWH